MKLKIGNNVVIKDSGDKGVITDILENGQLLVDVDGLSIPVAAGEVVGERTETEQTFSASSQQEEEQSSKVQPEEKSQSSDGIYLAFLPRYNEEDHIDNFQIFLLNEHRSNIQFQVTFYLNNEHQFKLNKPLRSGQSFFLADLAFDDINERPCFSFVITFPEHQTVQTSLKPKAKTFLKNPQSIPVLDQKGYLFKVVTNPVMNEQTTGKKEEKRQSIDKEQLIKQMFETTNSNEKGGHQKKKQAWRPPPYEVDLHIEKLGYVSYDLSNAEMVQIQLQHCREAVEEALMRNQSSLVIIHGVGKGKLKEEVHRVLQEYSDIETFKNEYHPRYGFGATFVWL